MLCWSAKVLEKGQGEREVWDSEMWDDLLWRYPLTSMLALETGHRLSSWKWWEARVTSGSKVVWCFLKGTDIQATTTTTSKNQILTFVLTARSFVNFHVTLWKRTSLITKIIGWFSRHFGAMHYFYFVFTLYYNLTLIFQSILTLWMEMLGEKAMGQVKMPFCWTSDVDKWYAFSCLKIYNSSEFSWSL